MHSKLFLENNKKKISCSSFIFQPSAAQDALNRLGPASARSPRPHPGRNLGLGRQTAPRARARLGLDLAQRISGVRSDPTDERPFRVDQNPGRGRRPGTLAISALALSLSFLSRSSEDSRYRAAASEESRAGGPLRRRRPPRRRACSPTGEHAAVERPGRGATLAEPGEFAPRLGFFFGAGGRAGALLLLLPRRWRFIPDERRVLSFLVLPRPLSSPFRRTGIRVRVWEWGFYCVSFGLFIRMGLGLGFQCAAFCSFPLSPFGFDFFLLSFLLTRSPEKGI